MKRTLTVIIFSILLVLLILETGLRLSGKYLTAEEKQEGSYYTEYGKRFDTWERNWLPLTEFNSTTPEFSHTYSINSFGFRDREYDMNDTLSKIVLVIGDSFIEGMGTHANSTFPANLEKLLVNRDSSYLVYNLGVSGSDVFFGFMRLRRMLNVLKPSHVIFTMNGTDLSEYITRGGFERFRTDGQTAFRQQPIQHRLYHRSHIMRFVYTNVFQFDHMLIPQEKMQDEIKQIAPALEACVDSAYALCSGHDLKFMFLTYPTRLEICDTFAQFMTYQYVKCPPEIPYYLDLREKFVEMTSLQNCSSYYWPEDGHFNSKGYNLFANAFFELVNDEYPGFWYGAN